MSDRSASTKQGVRGIVEDVKGKAKEAWASLRDDDKLRREARAQQRKGEAQRESAEAEIEAEKERAKARAYEAEQRSQQDW